PVVSWSPMKISPELGFSRPVRHLKKVLFPAPFGPIRQRSSRSRRMKSTWLTAVTPPKRMVNPRVSTTISAKGLLHPPAATAGPPVSPARRPPAEQFLDRGKQPLRQAQHCNNENGAEHEGVFDQSLLAEQVFDVT